MPACHLEVVYKYGDFIMTRCADCGRIDMLYRQCMLSFDGYSLRSFLNYMEQRNFENEKFPFDDHEDRIIIETYHPDVQICLVEGEFYCLLACLKEAKIQFEMLELIRSL